MLLGKVLLVLGAMACVSLIWKRTRDFCRYAIDDVGLSDEMAAIRDRLHSFAAAMCVRLDVLAKEFRNGVSKALWAAAGVAFVAGGLAGALIPAWQALGWLRTGFWYPISAGSALAEIGLSPYVTDWVGVQRIILGLLEGPLSLVLFLMGACLGASIAWLASRLSRQGRG